MKKRSPVSVVIFSLLTCGIYLLYWIYVTTNDIEKNLEKPDGSVKSGGMAVLLTCLTGVYLIYWAYKQGKRVAQMGQERSVTIADNSTIYLVCCLFGLVVVPIAMIQSNLNSIPEKAGATAQA